MRINILPLLLLTLMAAACVEGTPVAVDDEFQIRLDTPAFLPLTTNDTSPEGDTELSVHSYTQALHGTVSTDPNDPSGLNYSPNPGYQGEDFFTYVVRDSQNRQSNQAIVTLHVANRPYIAYVAQTPTVLEKGETYVVDSSVEPQGSPIVSVTYGGQALSNVGGNNWSGTFSAPQQTGEYTPDLVAIDALGRSSTYEGYFRVVQVLFTPAKGFKYPIFFTTPIYNYMFRIAGRVVQSSISSQFVLDDGSGTAVTVLCPAHGLQAGNFVVATGTPLIFDPNQIYFSVESTSRITIVE